MASDHPTRDDIDFISGAFWGSNPHDAMTWMRANAPVYWDGNVWGISRYADLKEISKDAETFSSAQGIRPDSGPQPMMIDMDDPEHIRRRKLINKGFTPKRVREREQEIRDVCDGIIDRALEKDVVDFVWDIAAPLPLIMIGNDLGVAPEDRDQLLEWSDAMLCALTGESDTVDRAAAAFGGYYSYATDVIADRRANPREDLMSLLSHAEVDGYKLDHDSLIFESLLILIGGDETTRHVISGGAYQVLADRGQWEKLVADPSKITAAVEEMLRWVSPIKNMARVVTRDVELHGQNIEEGQKLLLLYPSANRDESVFDEPFTFDIERTPNEHVAFGGFGTHFCLGNSLARLELKVMFEQLITRCPNLALVEDHEPEFRPANFVSGYEKMPVTLG